MTFETYFFAGLFLVMIILYLRLYRLYTDKVQELRKAIPRWNGQYVNIIMHLPKPVQPKLGPKKNNHEIFKGRILN
jgi:hypothetical protein